MLEYRLCEAFGWSYEELQNTPADIVDKFVLIMNAHAQKAKFDSKAAEIDGKLN